MVSYIPRSLAGGPWPLGAQEGGTGKQHVPLLTHRLGRATACPPPATNANYLFVSSGRNIHQDTEVSLELLHELRGDG